MAYQVMSPRDPRWEPRKGLEGPFWFVDRVLYYDAREGAYWDPTTDFYVANSEVTQLQNRVIQLMRTAG